MVESTFLFDIASGICITTQGWLLGSILGFVVLQNIEPMLSSLPNVSLLLIRWLSFRIMLNAGLVKWYGRLAIHSYYNWNGDS